MMNQPPVFQPPILRGLRRRCTEVQPLPAVVHDRRISLVEAHGSFRGRTFLYGGVRPQGLPHHQDIRQIIDEYGPNESIVSNCDLRIAYAPTQYETAELLSKMTGTKTIQKATFNFSGSRLAPIANHMSATVDHVERPLMTPDEVMRLRPPRRGATAPANAS